MPIKKLSILSLSIFGLVACNGGSSSGGDSNNPSLSITGATNVLAGNNTSVVVTLKNPSSVTTPINVSVTSSNSSILTKTPADQPCVLSVSDTTCTIKFYASSVGASTVSASGSGFGTVSQSVTVATNPSPTPDPVNINWVNTDLDMFLVNNNLARAYLTFNQDLIGNKLFVYGSLNSAPLVLQYNIDSKTWSNITNNLSSTLYSYNGRLEVIDEKLVYIDKSTGVWQFNFNTNTWLNANGLDAGYEITFDHEQGKLLGDGGGFLAANDNNSYKIYTYQASSNILTAIGTVNSLQGSVDCIVKLLIIH